MRNSRLVFKVFFFNFSEILLKKTATLFWQSTSKFTKLLLVLFYLKIILSFFLNGIFIL